MAELMIGDVVVVNDGVHKPVQGITGKWCFVAAMDVFVGHKYEVQDILDDGRIRLSPYTDGDDVGTSPFSKVGAFWFFPAWLDRIDVEIPSSKELDDMFAEWGK